MCTRWLCTRIRLQLQMHVYEYLFEAIQAAAMWLWCMLKFNKYIFFFLHCSSIWSSVSLNQTVHIHFSIRSLLIKGLSGTLLHLCLLHFFISFLFVTMFGPTYRGTVSWKDSSDGNPNQFVRSCMTDSLLAFRLKSEVGSGDWQGSWSHYAEIWDRIPALDAHSRPEAS